MSIDLEKVEKAVHLFYQGEDPVEQKSAHQWLLEVQKSVEGWQACWCLLDSQKDLTIQYYGAVMLYHKVCHNFADLDETQCNELKTKLCNLCLSYRGNHKFVLTKLSAGYVVLLIQTSKDEFRLREHLTAIEEKAKEFQVDPSHFIFELLSGLPIEFRKISSAPSKKLLIRNFIQSDLPVLLDTFRNILEQYSESKQYQDNVLTCLVLWMEFHIPVEQVITFIPILLAKILEPELSSKASDVLVEIVTAPTIFSSQGLIFSILHQILSLENHLVAAFKEDNADLLENMCVLFSNLGETHSRLFVKAMDTENQRAVCSLVKLMLKFTSAKGVFLIDETYSELTFNFWYSFQDELCAIDPAQVTIYHTQFYQVYLSLLEIFFIKCQLPPDDIYCTLNSDEKEKWRCYRIDIQDFMLYLYTLLQDKCLMYFQTKLQSLCREPTASWQEFDCCLYLLKGVAETVDPMESEYLPNILNMLERIPKHLNVIESLVLFLGSMSEWFNCHPESIRLVLPFILEGLKHTSAQSTCSISLKEICQECTPVFSEEMVAAVISSCVECISLSQTSSKAVVRLYNICASVMSALPSSQISRYLNLVIVPLLETLQLSIRTIEKTKIIHFVSCFQAFFQGLEQSETCDNQITLPVFTQLLPLIQQLIHSFCEEDVVVSIMSCMAKAFEIGREILASTVMTSVDVLMTVFKVNPFWCVIDSATIVISIFGKVQQFSQNLWKFFEEISSTCVALANNEEGRQRPDCMQSFMNCITRVTKTVPEFIFKDFEVTKSLLNCSLLLLNHKELPTLKCSTYFLVAFINIANSYEYGSKTIEMIGQDIFLQCLLCIGGNCPRHTTDLFAEILLAFNKNFVTLLAKWFNNIFSKDGFPTSSVTLLQKQQFQKAVLRERANKRRMKEMVKEFALVCRGIDGCTYAQ